MPLLKGATPRVIEKGSLLISIPAFPHKLTHAIMPYREQYHIKEGSQKQFFLHSVGFVSSFFSICNSKDHHNVR